MMNSHKTLLFEHCLLSVIYCIFLHVCHIEKQTMAACGMNTFIGITGIDKIALKSILIEIQNIFDTMLNMSVALAAA